MSHPYFATLRGLEVSAHFYVPRDGALWQFVSCDERAWHAGTSTWRGRDNCNDDSIGIELEGLEGDAFEPAQYETLAALCAALAQHYPIRHVAGHEHIAPGRKTDPGAGFDWHGCATAWDGRLRCFRTPRAEFFLSHGGRRATCCTAAIAVGHAASPLAPGMSRTAQLRRRPHECWVRPGLRATRWRLRCEPAENFRLHGIGRRRIFSARNATCSGLWPSVTLYIVCAPPELCASPG